jgi:hypothetical protein
MHPGVWARVIEPEGVPWGIGCGGPRGDPGVEDRPLGENPHVGRPDRRGNSPVCGARPSTATASSLWGGAKGV